jgi:hypothetical protein
MILTLAFIALGVFVLAPLTAELYHRRRLAKKLRQSGIEVPIGKKRVG